MHCQIYALRGWIYSEDQQFVPSISVPNSYALSDFLAGMHCDIMHCEIVNCSSSGQLPWVANYLVTTSTG
jgi:hypothetical protein